MWATSWVTSTTCKPGTLACVGAFSIAPRVGPTDWQPARFANSAATISACERRTIVVDLERPPKTLNKQ